jgi:hypothetical protein
MRDPRPISREHDAEDIAPGEIHPLPVSIKGRGAAGRPQGRFETMAREAVDDGWGALAGC